MRALVIAAVGACGGQPAPTTNGPAPVARVERAEPSRAEIVAKHRKLESAQQDALAATCSDAGKWAAQHCTPSCYPAEPRDSRAGTRLRGAVVVEHNVCQLGDGAPWFIADELAPRALAAKAHRGRVPRPHKAGTWQAQAAAAIALTREDVAVVSGGAAQAVTHPLSGQRLRCTTLAHYTHARGVLDACGLTGKAACEATGNAAARGINLARFRLAEAARAQAAGNDEACRTAALDAVATARGLPRWRQYAKLNVGAWTEGLAYRTRFDGVLDEDALFALAPGIATEGAALHAACGGTENLATTPEHEHAFHSCK